MNAAAAPRLVTLDGVRGLAVMGILLMNVNAFAMPFAAYDNPANYGAMRWPDVALWAVEFVGVDGKFRALFSALFGASLLLVAERAEAAGRSGRRTSLARLLTLLAIGLVHGLLLWAGDILALYALCGLVALPLRRLPVERLLVLAGLLLALQAAISGLHYQALFAMRDAASAPGAAPATIADWQGVLAVLGPPDAAARAHDLALHHGPWAALVRSRLADAPGMMVAELLFSGPETVGLMLLGMAGLRSGFLAGRWQPASALRLARIAYLVGVPPLLAMAAWLVAAGTPPLATALATDLLAMPFRWAVAIGHAAVMVRWFGSGPGPLADRIAAAGRAALSNYLGTSLVMAALFDGWGLGLYGEIERWRLLPLVLAAWLLMLAWSAPWLARFRHGPLEWAWRSLARGERQPMRRVAIASPSHLQ